MLVVVGATSGITRIPAGTSNTWSHAWASTLDQWPVTDVGEHRRDRVRLDRRPRLGPGLVEDAVEDPAVLHVAREEAEGKLRGLGPGHLVASGERPVSAGQQHVVLLVEDARADARRAARSRGT